MNIAEIIVKMKTVAKMWYYRTMTLHGKVTVVNSLIASLFVYRMQVLTILSVKQLEEIQETITDFLWSGKKPKIPMETLCASREDGGLGLANFKVKHESLLCTWVKDCMENANMCNLAREALGPLVNDGLIWKLNLNRKDSEKVFSGDTFWHDVIHLWHELNYHEPQNHENVSNQIIWYNSMVRVNNKPTWNKKLFQKGIVRVSDICSENMSLLSYEELLKKFNHEGNRLPRFVWLQYLTVQKAIPKYWLFCLSNDDLVDNWTSNMEIVQNYEKISRIIYHKQIATSKHLYKCARTWYKKADIEITIDELSNWFKNINKLMSVVKLRNFQYRLLHNKIYCNDVLVHWQKVETNICDFCKKEKQTIMHLLHSCEYANQMWTEFVSDMLHINPQWICVINFENILFNNVYEENTTHVINFLVLTIKQYLFRCKCQNKKPNYNEILYEFKAYYQIELYNGM